MTLADKIDILLRKNSWAKGHLADLLGAGTSSFKMWSDRTRDIPPDVLDQLNWYFRAFGIPEETMFYGLSEEQADELCERYWVQKETIRTLARRYEIDPSAVVKILEEYKESK